jgi:DNA-binding PadR family transcriptional regulator
MVFFPTRQLAQQRAFQESKSILRGISQIPPAVLDEAVKRRRWRIRPEEQGISSTTSSIVAKLHPVFDLGNVLTIASNLDIGFRLRESMIDRNLYSGLIRLHILHHAAEGPIFGQAMIDELGRHGYRLSAGTLYPILHGMERQGYLRSRLTLNGGRNRRVYRATPAGRKALVLGRKRVQELFGEMFENG